MAWLTEQLGAAGARLLPRRVAAVEELAGYDAVVNCSGEQGCIWGVAGWLGGQVLSCKSAALHTSVHLLPLAACFL